MPTTQETVEAMYDKLEAAGSTDPAEAAEPSGDTAGEVEATGQDDAERSSAGTVRDDKGRSTKGSKEPAAPVRAETLKTDADVGQGPVDGVPSPAPSTAPALPELKAPQDWRAAAKDKWSTASREIQEEALRTYAETRKTLDRAAALEKEAAAWREPLAPFEHVFRARGQTLQQGVAGLAQTYAALHTAPPALRGQMLGRLVREFLGADEGALTHLANGIHGSESVQPVAQPQAMSQEQFRQLARQEWEAAQREQGQAAAVKAWQDFEPTADLMNEQGVRGDVADLVGKWTRENPGQAPSKEVFQKAYDRACLMNEGAAKIVNQRKESAAAKAKASTLAAGSGVKNEPAGPSVTGKSKNTQDEVTKQWDRLARARV